MGRIRSFLDSRVHCVTGHIEECICAIRLNPADVEVKAIPLPCENAISPMLILCFLACLLIFKSVNVPDVWKAAMLVLLGINQSTVACIFMSFAGMGTLYPVLRRLLAVHT